MTEHAELLTGMLDDLLERDAEIAAIVRAAGESEIGAAELREAAIRRFGEALTACAPEERTFAELRAEADADRRAIEHFGGLRILVLPRQRRRWARHQELVARRDGAEKAWHEALRERGLKPLLRDEVNARLPRYRSVLDVLRVEGLAEIRNPLHVVESTAPGQVERQMSLMPGGSIGVSGSRGVGKTTLLEHFCDPAFAPRDEEHDTTVRVLLPAPVRYEAREFVLHLFARVCYAVLGPAERLGLRDELDGTRSERRSVRLMAMLLVAGIAGLALGAYLVIASVAGVKVDPGLSAGVLLLLGSVFAVVMGSELLRSRAPGNPRTPGDPLAAQARALLVGLAYQQSVAEGWNRAVKLPAGIELGASSTTTMTERPMNYPEIVARFREFLGQVAAGRRVHIGIDELDKFDSTDDARAFLNDIKGILAVRGCFFLIAVSQDAMSAFERRGLPLRDAFDSTFDTVIDVRPLLFADSRRLLRRRVIGLPEQFMALVHVMCGGLPRDLIRVARDLVGLSRAEGDHRLDAIADQLTALEVRRKLAAARLVAQRDGPPAAAEALAPDETPGDFRAAAHTLLAAASDGVAAEAAAYLYFCATVREYFARLAQAGRVDGAAMAKAARDADRLAECRHSFASGQRYAWSLISRFREASYLEPWSPG
ncbi:hypothetical protein ACQP2F_24570 [Actinoplanes sp. CA-030573]|uniref:hypothetical protein n=1 Tax=Actinoplanes sp. CA-030573 TaxID=3239898 RepID=UPI003D90EF2D